MGNHQRNVPKRFIDRHTGLAPDILLAQIVPMISAQNNKGILPEVLGIERIHDLAEPMIDHGELATIAGTYLLRLPFGQDTFLDRTLHIGWPDQMRAFPVLVIHGGIGFGRVEGFMRVELVDKEEEALMLSGIFLQPFGCRGHGTGTGKIRFGFEITTRVVIRHVLAHEIRGARPARIRLGFPWIALMAALIVPGGEVDMIIFTT